MKLGPAEVRFTGRREGDLRWPPGHDDPARVAVLSRRRAVVDLPWTWLRQQHGTHVVVVESPGDRAGEEGDALVTTAAAAPLAVLTADCAPVALVSEEGAVGVVHAGWRGLVGGVVEQAVEVMRHLGATRVDAALGACIRAECYEFGRRELDLVAGRLGDDVRATTSSGAPALDVPAAVRAALARAGAELVHDEEACTSCASDRFFSHRARGDTGRQGTVVWR